MAENGTSGNSVFCGTCPVRVVNTLLGLPPQLLSTVVIILAVGIVLSVLLFIGLSFAYPSHLSTVLGVIAPMLTVLFQGYKVMQQRKRIGDGGNNDSTNVSNKLPGN